MRGLFFVAGHLGRERWWSLLLQGRWEREPRVSSRLLLPAGVVLLLHGQAAAAVRCHHVNADSADECCMLTGLGMSRRISRCCLVGRAITIVERCSTLVHTKPGSRRCRGTSSAPTGSGGMKGFTSTRATTAAFRSICASASTFAIRPAKTSRNDGSEPSS